MGPCPAWEVGCSHLLNPSGRMRESSFVRTNWGVKGRRGDSAGQAGKHRCPLPFLLQTTVPLLFPDVLAGLEEPLRLSPVLLPAPPSLVPTTSHGSRQAVPSDSPAFAPAVSPPRMIFPDTSPFCERGLALHLFSDASTKLALIGGAIPSSFRSSCYVP